MSKIRKESKRKMNFTLYFALFPCILRFTFNQEEPLLDSKTCQSRRASWLSLREKKLN